MRRSDFLWELACQRFRRRGRAGRPGRCHRGQAHSYRWQVPLRFTVGAGKPTPIESCTGQISFGSSLASETGWMAGGVDRVDAIAGKPTPTKSRASQIYCRGKSSPTKSCATQIYCRSRQAHSQRVMHRSDFLWELACQRCRRRGQACACQVIGGTKLSSSSSTAWMILLT